MKQKISFLAVGILSSLPLFAEEGAAAAGKGNMMQTVIMIGLAFVFFYFILWRPEQKRRKTMEKLRSEMKKGDRVTAMGIIGHVAKIQDNSVILKMVDGSRIEVIKGAITEVVPATEEEAKKAEKEDSKRVDFTPSQD